MKRLCLMLSATAVATLSLPSVALAEPAILYVPTEAVDLTPSGMDACIGVSMGDYNSGLGCVPGLAGAATEAPYADAANLTTGVQAALDGYDIMVTNTRPVDFVPYYILLASDEVSDMSESRTCSGSPLTCAGRGRNGIAFTNGGTMNCSDPDALHAALYAIGRMAGLEAKTPDAAMDSDPMDFPPDFTAAATTYQDRCDAITPQLGGEDGMTELPLECTSADHETCDSGEQNSHADMLAFFGARTMDMDAPVITVSAPAEGDVIAAGDTLAVNVTVADAEPIVGVRISVASDALEGSGALNNTITACTNNQCDVNFLEGNPFKPSTDPFLLELEALPGGDYVITVEAADYHGNVAESMTFNVVVEAGDDSGTDTDSAGSDSDGSASASDGSGITGSDSDSDSDSGDTDGGGSGSAGEMTDDSGCACSATNTQGGGVAVLLLGLLGLVRRRRR